MMKEYVTAFCIVEIEDSVISRTKFPDVLLQMFCYICWEISAILRKKIDVEDDLIVLNTGILTGIAFPAKGFKKIPNIGRTVLRLLKFNLIHHTLLYSTVFMIAYLLSNGKYVWCLYRHALRV